MKSGYRTTEFWVTLVMGLVTAVLGVLVVNGLLSSESGDAIVQVISLLVAMVAPVVIGWMTTRYAHGRTALKIEEMRR